MCCKMCVTVAFCLVFLLAFSEGFFIPSSLRKQAPQSYNSPHWIPNGNNGVGAIQPGYGNSKDYNIYQQTNQQQQQQIQPQQQQQQQQPQQPQALYSTQGLNIQATAPKYEATQFQSVNQPQYIYEGVYPAPLNSYPQSMQLVPCLCPVNKEVIEQQNQQLQQQTSLPISPTSSSFSAESNNNPAAAAASPPNPANQKKTT